jgi:sensor histidine kinase YesM
MGWIAYAVAWLAAAVFWSVAAASTANMSPLKALPYGLLTMGASGLMGVGIWRLTDRVAWDWRSPVFYTAHLIALTIFSVIYSISASLPDFLTGSFVQRLTEIRNSPVLIWSLLMGSWLYLIVAGISYAIRAHGRIRTQEAAAADARLLAQQAQLAALRAQINPHFLFNALHSVGALVSTDPARADKALECLGDLLRYALGTNDEVLFEQEWAFTQDYLSFEELRLGDRLKVVKDVDAAAMSIPVPPLILQPLVENAVRHGIADRPEGGSIALLARVENDRLVLRVTDDGCGNANGAGDGLGLGSVRRRIAALYDGKATLSLDRLETGFAVTLRLPIPEDGVGTAA